MSVLGKLKRHFEWVCAGVGDYVDKKYPKLSLVFFGAGALVAAYEGLVDLPNYLLGVGGAGLAAGALLLAKDKPKLAGTSLLLANATLIINGGSLALSADSAGVIAKPNKNDSNWKKAEEVIDGALMSSAESF